MQPGLFHLKLLGQFGVTSIWRTIIPWGCSQCWSPDIGRVRVWRPQDGELAPPAVLIAHGGLNVWWVKPTHKTISKGYLKCLAMMEFISDSTFEHFRCEAYYIKVMLPKKLNISSDQGVAVPDDLDASVKKKRRVGQKAPLMITLV